MHIRELRHYRSFGNFHQQKLSKSSIYYVTTIVGNYQLLLPYFNFVNNLFLFRMDDEKLTETFFTHIRAGDLDKVSSLAAFDPSLLRRSLKSMTPLMEASYKELGFS